MRGRSAQLLFRDIFVCHGLDDVGTGDEHVAGFIHHEHEIGKGGRVDGAARAGPHDRGDLRDHAAGQNISQENVGVARERKYALLNARAARIVQADDRRAGLQREVHDLDDLLRVAFRKRSAKDGEILREDVRRAAVNQAPARDKAVTVDDLFLHAKIVAAMANQLVHLLKRAFVQQQVDAFARGKLAFVVLARAAFRASTGFGRGVAPP